MGVAIHWFRRDLRLYDNTALYHALSSGLKVLPIFIFDPEILEDLEDKDDARVTFIMKEIENLRDELKQVGSDILVLHGDVGEQWSMIMDRYDVKKVYFNRDYEPYAVQRDEAVMQMLTSKGVEWRDFKDHLIFDRDEVVKEDGKPYTVFTPYKKKWMHVKGLRTSTPLDPFRYFPSEDHLDQLLRWTAEESVTMKDIGFSTSDVTFPSRKVPRSTIQDYDLKRDFPGEDGTSRLGVHFRFGTISIREKARSAETINSIYLNELIWRDFYAMILHHFPFVVHRAFRPAYDSVEWRNNADEFEKWKLGMTGYPLVDAGMRELDATGYMHNRVRMVAASFLTKHLLIDWRWGEAWFARKLLDFDLASNNGGWQWAAGCGTDAAPYFRIFNPHTQLEKFDKKHEYVRRWVPEFGTAEYPEPIVDHKMARTRCLAAYKKALSNQ